MLFISVTLLAQSSKYIYDSINHSEKYFYANGQLNYEIIQLDKVSDKHRHLIFYNINGQKIEEFYEKDHVIYDTLRRWTDEGKMYHLEAYTPGGYTSIDYWVETGKISTIGAYEITKKIPDLVIYDSTTFNKYTTSKWRVNEPLYIRKGNWREYNKDGILACEGKYLPWPFSVSIPTKDSSGVAVPIENTSFEVMPGTSYIVGESYLKDGNWNYYDEKGKKVKSELYKNGLLIKK